MSPAAEVSAARKRTAGRKLTLPQVQEARTRHYVGGESFAALARTFDVGASTMRAAVVGETWKDAPITYRRPSSQAEGSE